MEQHVAPVQFNRPAALAQVDRVATDHAKAAGLVARRLHAAGHRRFVLLGGPADWPVNQERAEGFLAKLGAGDVSVLNSGPDYAGGREVFLEHVRREGVPDAVFCVTDPLAFGVLDACRFELGLIVPRDLSVVGFDDVAEAAHQGYDLTTVRQPIDQLASAAVEMLGRRLDAPGEGAACPAAGHPRRARLGSALAGRHQGRYRGKGRRLLGANVQHSAEPHRDQTSASEISFF